MATKKKTTKKKEKKLSHLDVGRWIVIKEYWTEGERVVLLSGFNRRTGEVYVYDPCEGETQIELDVTVVKRGPYIEVPMEF